MTNEEEKALRISVKLTLVLAGEIPVVGGIVSGIGDIILGETEPAELTEEDVKKLIQDNDIEKMRKDLDACIVNIKTGINEIRDMGFSGDVYKSKLVDLEDDTGDFSRKFQRSSMTDAEKFYSLPFFTIWANLHLLTLQICKKEPLLSDNRNAYEKKYTECIKSYASYLNDTYHKALAWRWNQISAKWDLRGLKNNAMYFKDEANPSNNYDLIFNETPTYYEDNRLENHIKKNWWLRIKKAYNEITGIEKILEGWKKICSDVNLPNNWRNKIHESALSDTVTCYKIKDSHSDKFLSHAGDSVHLTSGYGGHGELFLIEPIQNGEVAIMCTGNHTGAYLSHGNGNPKIIYSLYDGEKWKLRELGWMGNVNLGHEIECSGGEEGQCLVHIGNHVEIRNYSSSGNWQLIKTDITEVAYKK